MPTALWMVRKRAEWASVGAMAFSHTDGLLFVWDKMTGGLFLVDTGAEVSVFPATRMAMQSTQPAASLVAAIGSTIRTFGKPTITLRFTMKHYRWDFVIVEVSRPRLGADFLRATSLLVHLRGKQLVDAKIYFSSPLCEAPAPFPGQEMNMTSSSSTFQRSQGPTSPLCTPSMVLSTSSGPQDLPSMHGLVDCLQTG